MSPRRTAALAGFAVCLVHVAGAFAQAPVVDPRDLDERLKRLERLLGSEALVKLFEEVESMAIEIRDLRGQLEVQTHTINQLQQSQRDLYLDVDQRLQRVESAATTQVAGQQPTDTTTGTQTGSTVSAVGQSDASTTQAPAAATQAATGVDPFAEQQAYQSAFDLLKSGRYEDAAVAFTRFIADYPTGSYADNAQYWLGETYYITRRFDAAIQEFERLISLHPDSQKLTHALLKIGYAHDELGREAEAERVLGDLIARFPQSAAAGLARKRLVAIRQ